MFAGGNRQKFEIAGSNGYLGQNSTDIVVGLGDAKEADIVRMLWPTGVLQDEIQVAGGKQQNILEIDRRGSSCPTLFVWNGERYEFVADMLGAGVVGHWVGLGQRDIPRPVEYIKIDRNMIREKEDPHFSQSTREMGHPVLSFRFMEPLEEAVYLDQVRRAGRRSSGGSRGLSQRIFRVKPAVSGIQSGGEQERRRASARGRVG